MVMETGLVVIDSTLPTALSERLVEGVREELACLQAQPYSPPQVLLWHLGGLAPARGAASRPRCAPRPVSRSWSPWCWP